MKNIRLILLLLAFLPGLLSAQVQRKVLMEEFTNASCGPCAAQNPAFDALLSANSGKVVPIKYHTNWPGTDPMNAHNPTETATRVTYYNVTGVPHACMDGTALTGSSYTGAPANLTQAKINTRWAVPSPFIINLSYQKSATNDTVFVTMVVKSVQTTSGTLVAHIGVEEYEIHYANPPGSNGERDFSNVMKKMLPNASGTTLPSPFNTGDSVVLSYFWKFQNVYDPTMICVAGWVQDNATKTVHQAAFAPPVGPQTLNASPTAVPYPNLKVCGNSLGPVVTIKNLSGIALTNLDINYKINGSAVATYAWTGNLEFLETEDVSLPAIIFVPIQLGNKITIYTSMPNGQPDPTPANDTVVKLFNAAPVTGPVSLELKTDNFPAQTTWKVFNSSGVVVDQGGPYATGNTTYNHVLNISATDCYEFVIYDQGGNGICCTYGSGQYKLKNHLSQVFAIGAQFGAEESQPFKFDLALGLEQVQNDPRVSLAPNPVDDLARITLAFPVHSRAGLNITNEFGQLVYSLREQEYPAGEHTVDILTAGWKAGIYFLRLNSDEKSVTRKIAVIR